MQFFKAVVKFNGGRGALLCNQCRRILRQDFDIKDIADKEYYCEEHICPTDQSKRND